MSQASAPNAARSGALSAAAAYLCWGLFPIFWKQLSNVDALELIAHRHLWSLLFVAVVMMCTGSLRELAAAVRNPEALKWHAWSGVLLTLNWLVFVWGVNHDHVIEASLGYFLVPLVNVAIGRLLLHEHLRRLQWLAIAFAAVGVGVMLYALGRLPWIALSLAATFGAYGLLRKKSPLGPLVGLGLETLLLAPLALGFLLWREHEGLGALGHVSVWQNALIISAGAITAVPLILFANGARRIRFTTLGLLQYIAPTVQFAIGAWLYHEAFSPERAAAFGLIWCGLVLYTADNLAQPARVTAPAADLSRPTPSRTRA
jgi:chloramphenicol-sensitive protein RarD